MLSISLVTHNSDLKKLKETFLSVKRSKLPKIKLYVIDNSENPKVADDLKSLLDGIFASNEFELSFMKNRGMGAGHNTILEKLEDPYHLILNPDVEFSDTTLVRCCQFMERHKSIGMLAPAVYGSDQEMHHLCKENPSLFIMFLRSMAPQFIKELFAKTLERYEMRFRNYNLPMINVPYLTGCFQVFRLEALKKIGGFDEQFFYYYDDADITRTLLKYYDNVYWPQEKIIHHWERGAHKNKKLKWIAIFSGLKYSWKWLLK